MAGGRKVAHSEVAMLCLSLQRGRPILALEVHPDTWRCSELLTVLRALWIHPRPRL